MRCDMINLSDDEEVLNKVTQSLEDYFVVYKQYLHKGICKTGPCQGVDVEDDLCCMPFIHCIHASNKLHNLPKHPNCDCYYQDVQTKALGSISDKKPSPDVWLKLFGKLPDYYITKTEAEKLGWGKGKKLSAFANGKMIGGDIYKNKKHILPEKEGRVWYECDINYFSGRRNELRLYYSNDGLMFYSTTHLDGNVIVYWIK